MKIRTMNRQKMIGRRKDEHVRVGCNSFCQAEGQGGSRQIQHLQIQRHFKFNINIIRMGKSGKWKRGGSGKRISSLISGKYWQANSFLCLAEGIGWANLKQNKSKSSQVIQSLKITFIKDSRNLKMGRVSLEVRRYKLRKWKTWNGSWIFIAELREERTYRTSGIHQRRAKALE